jgi:hypothetical protein
VILANGANAANVFWQVAGSATIGQSSEFQGSILARSSISLLNGSTLADRALAIRAATYSATFSQAMNPSTINASTFTLMQDLALVSGTVTYAGTVASFSPLSVLVSGAQYTARITTGAENLAGHPLDHEYSWSFIAGSGGNPMPPAVTLAVPK